MTAPLSWTWTEIVTADGEVVRAMRPSAYHQREADGRFTVGESYRLEVVDEVSAKSRGHYHAVLKEAFDNLPDHLRATHPTVDHLRKFALIMTGFCTSRQVVCETQAQALRFAAVVRELDEYVVAIVDGNIVTILRAKSMSASSMKKAEYQEAKDKTLAYVAGMIGVTPDALSKSAGRAA